MNKSPVKNKLMNKAKKQYLPPSASVVRLQGSCLLDDLNSTKSAQEIPTKNENVNPEQSLSKSNSDYWLFDEE